MESCHSNGRSVERSGEIPVANLASGARARANREDLDGPPPSYFKSLFYNHLRHLSSIAAGAAICSTGKGIRWVASALQRKPNLAEIIANHCLPSMSGWAINGVCYRIIVEQRH